MARFRFPSSAPSRAPAVRRRVARAAEGEAEAVWAWASSHRGRPAAPPPPSAGVAAASAVRALSRQLSPAMSEIDAHWEAIVGPELARWSRPERFASGAGGLALVVRARGPAAALLDAQAPRILERVARYAGKTPTRLRLVQGPLKEAFAPGKARPPRIRKVPALDAAPKNLDALLQDWAEAIARREGAPIPPRPDALNRKD